MCFTVRCIVVNYDVILHHHPQSPVVSTTFAKFHPSYLIGGTLSGQVRVCINEDLFINVAR